ncbi:MAG: hypothetical protein GKR94_10250 [Gammaproteobacteria bacterium]|nr:hypothetical protein [Gammaproteobacteria bacterium]
MAALLGHSFNLWNIDNQVGISQAGVIEVRASDGRVFLVERVWCRERALFAWRVSLSDGGGEPTALASANALLRYLRDEFDPLFKPSRVLIGRVLSD